MKPIKMWAAVVDEGTLWDAGFGKTQIYDRPMMLVDLRDWRELVKRAKGKR